MAALLLGAWRAARTVDRLLRRPRPGGHPLAVRAVYGPGGQGAAAAGRCPALLHPQHRPGAPLGRERAADRRGRWRRAGAAPRLVGDRAFAGARAAPGARGPRPGGAIGGLNSAQIAKEETP